MKIPKIMFIFLFLLMLIPLVSATWNKAQGIYDGIDYTTNYWGLQPSDSYDTTLRGGSAGSAYFDAYGDGDVIFQPLEIYDSNENRYLIFVFNNVNGNAILYNSELSSVTSLSTNRKQFGNGVVNDYDGDGLLNVYFLVENQFTFEKEIYNIEFNGSSNSLTTAGFVNLSVYFDSDLISGGDLNCIDALEKCYILTLNSSLIEINFNTDSGSVYVLNINNGSSCGAENNISKQVYTHLLGNIADNNPLDAFYEGYFPSDYNCQKNSIINNLSLAYVQLSAGNPVLIQATDTKCASGHSPSYKMYDSYPRVHVSNYDGLGNNEVFVECVDTTGGNTDSYVVMYSFDNDLSIQNWKKAIFDEGIADIAQLFISNSMITYDYDYDAEYEICSSYSYFSVLTYAKFICVDGYDGNINTLFTKSLPQALPNYDEIVDLDNDGEKELLFLGTFIVPNISTNSVRYITLDLTNITGLKRMSGFSLIDSDYNGNYELYTRNSTAIMQYSSNYSNNQSFLFGYVYDTGSPICINSTRTYFSPSFVDTESDLAAIRAHCGATGVTTNYSVYDSTLGSQNVQCGAGSALGTFTDSVCIKDTAHGIDGNCINLTYDVRQNGCYNAGNGSGYTYYNNSEQNDISSGTIPGDIVSDSGAENAISNLFSGMGFNSTASRMMLALIIIIIAVLMTAKFGVWAMIISGLLTFIGLVYLGLIPIWVLVVMILIMGVLVFFKFYNGSGGAGGA